MWGILNEILQWTVLIYLGSLAFIKPYGSINKIEASKSDELYDCVKDFFLLFQPF